MICENYALPARMSWWRRPHCIERGVLVIRVAPHEPFRLCLPHAVAWINETIEWDEALCWIKLATDPKPPVKARKKSALRCSVCGKTANTYRVDGEKLTCPECL